MVRALPPLLLAPPHRVHVVTQANAAVAQRIHTAFPLAALLRRHTPPSPHRFAQLQEFAAQSVRGSCGCMPQMCCPNERAAGFSNRRAQQFGAIRVSATGGRDCLARSQGPAVRTGRPRHVRGGILLHRVLAPCVHQCARRCAAHCLPVPAARCLRRSWRARGHSHTTGWPCTTTHTSPLPSAATLTWWCTACSWPRWRRRRRRRRRRLRRPPRGTCLRRRWTLRPYRRVRSRCWRRRASSWRRRRRPPPLPWATPSWTRC